MKKKFIVLLTMAIFTFGSVSAFAADSLEGNYTLKAVDESVVEESKSSSEDLKQLLIDSLSNADFEQLEYYLALFAKYSDEDINSLTANEILDYINLYGSYTGKDLISELGLEEVKENIDSFSNLINFEDILYEAEDYYGYLGGSSTSSSDSNVSSDSNTNNDSNKLPINDTNNKVPDKPDNKNQGNEIINNDRHKNWGDDKKLKVDNFVFGNDIVTQFKDFLTKCYAEYLSGNLSIEEILTSILNGDYSSIQDALGTVINNSDSVRPEGGNMKGDEFSDGCEGNDKNDLDKHFSEATGNINTNKDNDDKENMNNNKESSISSTTNTELNGSASTNNAASSKTGDASNFLLIASGVLGLLGTIKKKR